MAAYSPATITVMRQAVDAAWGSLSEQERKKGYRSELAVRVLAAAVDGETDLEKLTHAALTPRLLNGRGH